tara:strand:- start:3484 stop:4410 length:927 start_codon:yes stop_codon:yes gene_type:complete
MAADLLLDRAIATPLGVVGMVILFATWKSKSGKLENLAPIGWVLTGLYFFNDAWFYASKEDIILTVMSGLTLPGAVAISVWERKVTDDSDAKALRWFRGAVSVAGLPYILIAHVPILNVLAIWFVAWQSAAFLSFAGGSKVTLGDTYARPANGEEVLWESWEGNKWFLTEEMSEYSFHTELLVNGEPIFINFVLACTAIQSIIIFVGAISVLEVDWRKRVRALFIALSLIHILNLFRNAGLIWLQMGYPNWNWMNMSIFEFGHSYASRFVSLFAMFLLALVLFEMLPQMHKHVLRLLRPLGFAPKLRK